MLTLAEAQTDRGICSIIRVDPSTQDFTDRINEACERLVNRGNWWATVAKLSLTVTGHEVVWPRCVGTPLAINEYHHRLIMRNQWYNFLPLDDHDYVYIGENYHRRHHHGVGITYFGTSPVFYNVPHDTTAYLVAKPRNSADYGRSLYVWGEDANDIPVRETLVLGSDYVVSTNIYSTVTRVEKNLTADYVDLYQSADGTTTTLTATSAYAPSETRPEYRVSILPRHCWQSSTTTHHVSALVKLQHIDAVATTDLLSIGNRAAIKLMLQAIIAEEADSPQLAETKTAEAVHELNLELENRLPKEQIAVELNPFGTATPARHAIGRMQ